MEPSALLCGLGDWVGVANLEYSQYLIPGGDLKYSRPKPLALNP